MNRNIMIPAFVVAAGMATAGGLALAKQAGSVENDAVSDLAKARITLIQAVGTAETQAGGKATKAELESERGALVFSVEVVAADGKVVDFKVDAVDGKVLSTKQDQVDRAGKEGDDD